MNPSNDTTREKEKDESKPQISFGISIFEMSDGSIVSDITGKASYGKINRLLIEAVLNIQAEQTATIVVEKMSHETGKRRIVEP